MSASQRIARRFARLKQANRAGFVTFTMAGDPDPARCLDILRGLPAAGADLIELGMPFSDPMADGPAVQEAGKRALAERVNLHIVLDLAARFRAGDADTPLILMGYYNPIYRFGAQAFAAAAGKAGVDGLIIVDLPPEEDEELAPFTRAAGIDLIRLVTPTTDAARLPKLIAGAGGFLYYVSITGVTGTRAAAADEVAPALARLRKATDLPIAVGFGIRSPEQAAAIGAVADAVVVGSSIADAIANALASGGDAVAAPLDLVRRLSAPLRAGRA